MARAVVNEVSWLKPRYSRRNGEVVGHGIATVVDPSVWTPGRLVFVGSPLVSPGLEIVPPSVEVLNPGSGRVDTSRAELPPAEAIQERSKAIGVELRLRSDRSSTLAFDAYDLTYATELELQGGRTVTVKDALAKLSKEGKLRCQAPFRESKSFAAFLRHGKDGRPFVHDVGTGTTHWLCDAESNQLGFESQAEQPEVPNSRDTTVEQKSDDAVVEPINIFGDALHLPPEWRPEHYPAVISSFAQDVHRRLGVDPAAVCWMMIVSAGALIDDFHKLQVKAKDTGWRESARLWCALIGDPSAKKTPALNEVLKPVLELQAEWYREYQAAKREWKAKRQDQASDEPPQLRKVIVNDSTVEGLASVLENNPWGVLVVHDKLSGWFGSMDAYRNKGVSKDRGDWLRAYNGGQYFIDRATGEERHRFIPNWSASILGGIQPDPIRDIASRLQEDGLLQRFVPVVMRSAVFGSDVSPDAVAIAEWGRLVRELPQLDATTGIVRLSPEAQGILDKTRALVHALGQHPGYDRKLKYALEKGEGQLARIALIYHCIEDRTGRGLLDDIAPGEVLQASTARKAADAYLQYVIPSMVAFYEALIGESPVLRDARWVAGYVLARGSKRVTERELYRAYNEFRDPQGRRRRGHPGAAGTCGMGVPGLQGSRPAAE